MSISIERSLASVSDDLRSACRDTEDQSIFLSETWFRGFLEFFPDDRDSEPFFLVRDGNGDGACHILPLVREGSRLRSMTNYYSAGFGILGSPCPKDMTRHVQRMVEHLSRLTPRITMVRLQPIKADCPDYRALADGFRSSGWMVEEFFCAGNWTLPNTFRNFDEYLRSRPARLRNTLQRRRRRLERKGAEITVHSAPEAIAEQMPRFALVYEKSWKSREAYPDFVRRIAESFAELNAARLGLVCIDGVPVAAQLWFVHRGTASIYKLAHDEAYRNYSPGSVLTAEMLRCVLERDRVDRVDFLYGDEEYKRDWMSEYGQYWGLVAYNPRTWSGMLRSMLLKAKRWIRGRSPTPESRVGADES